MAAPVLDDFMLRLVPAPPQPVDPALLRARASIRAALSDMAGVADTAMEKGWPWRDDEADVRYGFYRQYEALEDLRARLAPSLAEATRGQLPARALLGAATEARWDLHGLLAGLAETDLDRDPGQDQWTVRRTLGHIVNGQRAYGWFTAWWLSRRDAAADDFPARVPDDVATSSGLPEEETEAEGSPADIGARLDDVLDLTAGAFAALDEGALATRARWSGIAVDVRFRLARWSSHMREHTVQVEKTLAMIGSEPTEAARLARLVAAAWGRLEADIFMHSPGAPGVAEAIAEAEEAAAGIATDARSVRAAAG